MLKKLLYCDDFGDNWWPKKARVIGCEEKKK